MIWAILIAPVDNILKPILLGRGVEAADSLVLSSCTATIRDTK
jgi:hypothetical protein